MDLRKQSPADLPTILLPFLVTAAPRQVAPRKDHRYVLLIISTARGKPRSPKKAPDYSFYSAISAVTLTTCESVITHPSHDSDTPHDEHVSEDEPPNKMPCAHS